MTKLAAAENNFDGGGMLDMHQNYCKLETEYLFDVSLIFYAWSFYLRDGLRLDSNHFSWLRRLRKASRRLKPRGHHGRSPPRYGCQLFFGRPGDDCRGGGTRSDGVGTLWCSRQGTRRDYWHVKAGPVRGGRDPISAAAAVWKLSPVDTCSRGVAEDPIAGRGVCWRRRRNGVVVGTFTTDVAAARRG